MQTHSSPADDATPRSFSQELSEAVRTEHLALNRLITARLPLCLPPHTSDPLLYTKGMIVFRSIYRAFESQIAMLLSTRTPEDRIYRAIAYLDIPLLRRSNRLETDMTELRYRLQEQYQQQPLAIKTTATLLTCGLESNFPTRTPHLALAYTWTMYLAIFNGGRWIRKQLRDAGEEFWMGKAPLSFWEFDGENDGEGIKAHFKENFEAAARLLTREEKDDVIREARKVFVMCRENVSELDKDAASTAAQVFEDPHGKRPGSAAGLLHAFGYVGPFYLLALVWQILVQTYASWSSVLPVAAAKDVHVG